VEYEIVSGVDYRLLQNSWDDLWRGDKGFYKIKMNNGRLMGSCMIIPHALIPVIKTDDLRDTY
jgi:hypothetical protein